MDADAYLASLGIKPLLDYSGSDPHHTLSPPRELPVCDRSPYPTATVATVSSIAFLSTLSIAYLAFKTRHMIRKYMRNHFDYFLSDRADLKHELLYKFYVGTECINSVTLPLTRELEMSQARNVPVVEQPAGDELLEIVTRE